MCLKLLTLLFSAVVFQHVHCATRAEIRNQFQPTLLRLRDLANLKYTETSREYTALIDQLNRHQTRTRNSTQTQINNIRKVISDARSNPNVTSAVQSCLRNHEIAANRLTTNSLNQCLTYAHTSALVNSKGKYSRLASVSANTASYCDSLNPLETQLEPYGKCLGDKIPDLNRQINIVGLEYQQLSNATLNYNIRCLSENAGGILGQIGTISYKINICFLS